MTAIQRVRHAQRMLGAGAVLGSAAWGFTAALSVLVIRGFVAFLMNSTGVAPQWLSAIAIVAGIAAFGTLLWRARFLRSTARVALWLEEKLPALHYALVTAIEPQNSASVPGIESVIQREDLGGVTRQAVTRSLLPALGAAALAVALLYVSPNSALGRNSLTGRGGGAPHENAANAGSRIEKISVDVTPPSYTGQRTSRLDDPSSVTALVGSRIVVTGQGSANGLTASLGTAGIATHQAGDAWTSPLTMPPKPVALTLRDRQYERIIVLDPRMDSPPKIVLMSPLRDTTMRSAKLVIHLAASATDDIGLNSAYFEYLITTGSGEIFSAKTQTTSAVRLNGARTGSISGTLDLGTLKLNQGDVVSIRAIAQDVNTLSGPGIATSDTRTFRIARADEYDSVAVDAAAPSPVDTSAMSQRMLIMMTEKLVKDQKKLTHGEVVKRSREIGELEDRIRRRVHDILFETETASSAGPAPGEPLASIEEQEPPDEITGLKQPDLAEAYQALWSAVRSLQIAEPAPALPPMRAALKALDRARLANRLYLRGTPPKVIVDIARVRMTGKEKGSGSLRTPQTPADSSLVQLERRFGGAIELLQRSPANAIRELTLLRVDALSTSPVFASALSDAVDAFHKGKDATLPLLRARRALSGDPVSKPGLPSWSGSR